MRWVVAALTATVVGLITGPVSAFFLTSGTGVATAVAASVPRPTQVTAVQGGEGLVRIAWSVESASLPVSHRVERMSGTTTTVVCTTTARSCDDTGVAPGPHSYRVVSTYRTWSSPSTSSATITVIDHPPTVVSFVRTDPSATNLTTVGWQLSFSEPVTGLGTANFTISSSGLNGATLASVSGAGTSWTVMASTGTGSGTLAVALTSSTGVTDSTGNPLTVPVHGDTYAIRPFFPTSLTLANGGSNNRIDTGDALVVTFSTTIDQSTLCLAWTSSGDHSSASATVTVVDGVAVNDSLTFTLATCPELRLGTVTLGSNGYVAGGSATFTATLTSTASTSMITLVLGARSGTGVTGSVGSAPNAVFVPDARLAATNGAGATGSVVSTGRF